MPWKENRTVDLRVQLIQDYSEGHSISALAGSYEVSRKAVYKWLERHRSEGVAGSPAAAGRPPAFARQTRRRDHRPDHRRAPTLEMGATQAEGEAVPGAAGRVWPAEITIGEVLKRAGLTQPRKLRVRTPPYGQPFAAVEDANQTWCADCKGWFRTGDGTRCDPLTIGDAHSRYSAALPHRAQSRWNACGRGNRTGLEKVLPMSSDKSVTYVPGRT